MKNFLLVLSLTLILYSCQKTDDQLVALCDAPELISISNTTNNSVTISWNADISVESFILEYGPAGFQVGSGILVSSNNTSLIISGLQEKTTYEFYARSYCSEGTLSLPSEVASFTTKTNPVATDFMPSLSLMNLYSGSLSDLIITDRAFEYLINTPLFSDYAEKQRIIALPENTNLTYVDDLLPDFPDNTVIAKTFYYNIDDRDESLGKTILETRILIKKDGIWQSGNYVWNTSQTDAFLDPNGSTKPVSYINSQGETLAINYELPSNQDCITCHQNAGYQYPIGPKLRSMNFTINGSNQLQNFIDKGYILGVPDTNSIESMPNWEDTSFSLEERSRAYFDTNCAHCHQPGGYFEINNGYNYLDLRYETPFTDSKIYEMRYNITFRMQTELNGLTMPFIGTTLIHSEGFDLIEAYIDTL